VGAGLRVWVGDRDAISYLLYCILPGRGSGEGYAREKGEGGGGGGARIVGNRNQTCQS
jgi:hypothetical protein